MTRKNKDAHWWSQWDLNPQPLVCDTSALPIEP